MMATYEEYMRAARKALAANDETAARRLIQMAKRAREQSDGTIATTPDGGRVIRQEDGSLAFTSPNYSTTDPATIERIMQGDGVREVVQSGFDRDVIAQNPVGARVNEFNRGTPFIGSRLDEAVEGVGQGIEWAGGLVGASPVEQFGQGLQRGGEAMRITSDAMRRENPGETMALNLAGAAGYGIPMGMAAARLPGVSRAAAAAPTTRAGQVIGGGLLGLGLGAGEGYVYGSGEGRTAEERSQNAREQATIGAAFGGALGAAAPVVGEVFGALASRWRGSDIDNIARQFNVSSDTAKVLKQAFEQNDQSAFERIMRAGNEATLADAGRSGQALLDAAAQTGGRPLSIVDDAVTARANRSEGLLSSALDESLGPVRGPRQAAREIAEESRPARQAAYDAAYGTPIDYASPQGRAVEEAFARVPNSLLRSAIQDANDEMLSLGIRNEQILVGIAEDGSVRFREMPNVRQMDEIKKSLDRLAARDEFGRIAPEGVRPARLSGVVRDATVEATGGPMGTYAQALKVGGDKIEMDNALRFGLQMLRNSDATTREVVRETVENLSADGRAMMRTGLRSYLDELMARVRSIPSDPDGDEARQALAALKDLSSESARGKLRFLLGPEEFDRLIPKLDEAMASQGMKASVARNSATAVRQSIQGTVDEITQPGLVGQLARGEPVNATKRLTQELLNTTPGADAARKEQIWSEIAQVLSERRGSRSAEAALRYIEGAIAGQPLTEAQARLIAQQTVIALPPAASRVGNQALASPPQSLPTR